jgi:hypothetical protein
MVDVAVEMREAIEGLLQQPNNQRLPFDDVVGRLISLATQCRAKLTASTAMSSV